MGKTRSVIVAPSLLSADQLNIEQDMRDAERCGADWHHVDVMDGHYVPNLTFGLPLIKALKSKSKLPLDVHLMITNPDETALDYVKAGADWLSFHIEVARHPHRLAEAIRKEGAKAGVAINPGTSLTSLWAMLNHIDFINVMSVNPGFSGQSFITESIARISEIYTQLKSLGLEHKVAIQVDGGVNQTTGTAIVAAGASVLVTGNFFYGAKDRAASVASLHKLSPL